MRHTLKAFVLVAGILSAAPSIADAQFTDIELKWLKAAEPVLDFARDRGLPIDVVVLPDSEPNDVPLSMGVRKGRCKLMLSMRGNKDAEATLADTPVAQHVVLIEAMVAHEVAHCWRFVQGDWHQLPAGFTEPTEAIDSKELHAKKKEMSATRREEGYADLVALAWTLREHRTEYSEVHDWLEHVRRDQPVKGSFHDTRTWLKLAKDQTVFPANDSPFEQVKDVWAKGVRIDD